MRAIIGLVLLLIPLSLYADSLTFKWTAPTKFEDGTTLNPSTDIDHYTLYCGPTTSNYLTTISTGTSATSYVMASQVYDPIYCVVTAVSNTKGSLESVRSSEVVGYSKGRIRGVNAGGPVSIDTSDGIGILRIK